MTTYVHLHGARTLDTVYQQLNQNGTNIDEAKANSVAGQLQTKLGDQYTVINHAYEQESYLRFVFDRGVKGIDPNTTIMLLRDIKQVVSQDPAAIHYVIHADGVTPSNLRPIFGEIPDENIRSILVTQLLGGNDSAVLRKIKMVETIFAAIIFLTIAGTAALAVAFVARKINRFVSGPICLIGVFFSIAFYRAPFTNKLVRNILGGQPLGITMRIFTWEGIGGMIVNRAREKKIPVLDLTNTLTSFQQHYVKDYDLPSKEGSEIIAEGIATIVRNYDTHRGVCCKPSTSAEYSVAPYPDQYKLQINHLIQV